MTFVVAVMTHNTIHCPIFYNPWLNRLFSVGLSWGFGNPASGFLPGHNLSHHRFLNQRRDNVRTPQTAPAPEARPKLFKPVQTVALPPKPGAAETPDSKTPILEPEPPAGGEKKPESTTSRLLDAKRKAQRKRD